MFYSIKFFFRLVVFWLLFFFFFRILFVITQFKTIQEAPLTEIIRIFYAGLRLDISAICYIITLPFLLVLLQFLFRIKFLKSLNTGLHAVLIFSLIGVCLGNISLYKSWGTIINARAIFYLSQPKEVFASISNIEWFISFSIWSLIFILFFWLFRKYIKNIFPEHPLRKLTAFPALLISLPLIISGARGGLQLIPINESSAYFSTRLLFNQVATNPAWYLGHSMLHSRITGKNPFNFFTETSAKKQVELLLESKPDSTVRILNIPANQKPNVVIIILESWSADVIKALGGEENVAPQFDQLKNDGILFNNVYSAGFRTDQGVVSILSGYPAQPDNSIIRYPEKTEKLPSLVRDFKNNHYRTSFYYGGEIAFANMNSYLLNAGCDKLITEDDFDSDQLISKWGIYDEHVLNKHAEDLNNEKQPFFSVLLTLSTHEPFDIPITNPFGNKTLPDQFRGAAYYTDQCLGNYFKKIKTAPWFNNTLFILLADHGHPLPKENNYEDPAARRMTMMIYGNLVKPEYKGTVIHTIAGQHDFAATLLSQLGIGHSSFKWSNNIFNTNRNDFAYISLDYGLNWVLPGGYFTYYFNSGNIAFPKGKEHITETDITNAKSYIQCLYKDFLEY